MQDSNPAAGAARGRLANPLLDFVTAMAEAQLKYWQAYQVEGAAFVAKRMRADLEFLRALGHCGDPQAIAECQWSWLGDVRKDYAEEMARLAGTTVALGISEIVPMGSVFTRGKSKASNGLDQTAHEARNGTTL
jgi:hypothetical protein